MDYVRRYVARANVTEVVVTAPARLHFGMLDPAGLGIAPLRRLSASASSRRGSSSGSGSRSGDRRGHRSDRRPSARSRSPDAPAPAFGLQRRRRGRRARGDPAAHRARVGHQARPRDRPRAWPSSRASRPGPSELADASGRGARSSVGAWTFAAPGLVVEAGVRDDGSISPLVARHPMPERWRCVLALPLGVEGLSGNAEERFFGLLHEERTAIEPRVSRLVLTALLPGLRDRATSTSSAPRSPRSSARSERCSRPGRAACFIRARRRSSRRCWRSGVGAVGQSSWGPSVYGIVDGPERATDVADRLRAGVDADTEVLRGRLRPPGGAGGARTARARRRRDAWEAKLLVSVVSADEARRALAGGADIIDVKDPGEGALGRAVAERPVRGRAVRWDRRLGQRGARRPARICPHTAALAARGATVVRGGLRQGRAPRSARARPRGGGDARGGGRGGAACLGDRRRVRGRRRARPARARAGAGCRRWWSGRGSPARSSTRSSRTAAACTGGCRSPSSPTWSRAPAPPAAPSRVAGQLRLGELRRVDADVVGVRSAVCRGSDRTGELESGLVAAAVAELRAGEGVAAPVARAL